MSSGSTATPNALPSDWTALGVTSGFEPEPLDHLRVLILGPPGQGKTTLVASIPNSLMLDFEAGGHSIIGGNSHRKHIQDYDMYQTIIKQLITDAKNNKRVFQTVVFDTGDSWSDLLIQQFLLEKSTPEKQIESLDEYGSHGAGYGRIRSRALNDLNSLYFHGYSWVITGHIGEKTITAADGKTLTVLRPTMFPSLVKGLWGRADMVGTVERAITTKREMVEKTLPGGKKVQIPGQLAKKKSYVLGLIGETLENSGGLSGGIDDKARLPGMVDEFELPSVDGWNKLADFYSSAAENARKLDGEMKKES